ncbi:MAG: undecaprenyl/decaprenyl-phosphate alpha-N-acetylglucosaminyl 1-phosphate transferase [Planctomycetales bacterium]|nr:undecaprenyl/decaprenyl-phosphate alpha-N-acetylglucosaminyl 1-phosphate transferase [Planctomycetales bacterium]
MTPAIAVLTGAIALLAALLLTPRVMWLAYRVGAVDAPDKGRKTQREPVALLGGVAVCLAAAIAVWIVSGAGAIEPTAGTAKLLRGLIPALLVMMAVGLVDDLYGLTGIYKLVGQFLSIGLLLSSGFGFHEVSLFGYVMPLNEFGFAFTLFFCVGCVNAFNLIDGIDGLASSVGAIVLGTLGVVAASLGNPFASMICFAACGALIAFLRFNGPPARMYLGDTGSMLIGLLVAAVSVHCATKTQAAFALMVPVAICAIPILDASAAMVRRVTTGQSVFTPDRGHLHHSLLLRGWSVKRTVASIAGMTAVTCAGALASFYTGLDYYAMAAAVGVFVALASAKVFGHVEVLLVAKRTSGALRRVLRRKSVEPDSPTETVVHLQGTRVWQVFWEGLTEAAQRHGLSSLRLTVNIPRLHEQFYANWNQPSCRQDPVGVAGWELSLPLTHHGTTVGKLSATGRQNGAAGAQQLQELLEYVEPLESQLARVIAVETEAATQHNPVVTPVPQYVANSGGSSHRLAAHVAAE